MPSINFEVNEHTVGVVRRLLEKSRELGREETRYTKRVESYLDFLLDFAINRKAKELKAIFERNLDKAYKIVREKVANGQRLTIDEKRLYDAYKLAQAKYEAQKTAPITDGVADAELAELEAAMAKSNATIDASDEELEKLTAPEK